MFASYRMNGFSPQYPKVLDEVKKQQNKLFWQMEKTTETESMKESAFPILQKYINDSNTRIDGWSSDELTERLYNDLFEDSILTNPLKDIWVERIYIKSWDNVFVRLINGRTVQIDGFNSPQHAIGVIRYLLSKSKINTELPMITGTLTNNIRINAIFTPIIKDSIGVSCSIQKLKRREYSTQEYVSNDFASKNELDFLLSALSHGISILIAGKWGAGKTTLMEYLLSSLPDGMQIINIEQHPELYSGTSLLLADDIPNKELIDLVQRFDPDIIGFNVDTCTVQNASLNGCTVVATSIAGNPRSGLMRAAEQWWKNQSVLDYHIALELTCNAFPLVVTINTYADNKHRIANISECSVKNGQINLKTLWEYQVQESSPESVCGHHRQVSEISDSLLEHMKLYEIPIKESELLKKENNENVRSESNRETCCRSTDTRNNEK